MLVWRTFKVLFAENPSISTWANRRTRKFTLKFSLFCIITAYFASPQSIITFEIQLFPNHIQQSENISSLHYRYTASLWFVHHSNAPIIRTVTLSANWVFIPLELNNTSMRKYFLDFVLLWTMKIACTLWIFVETKNSNLYSVQKEFWKFPKFQIPLMWFLLELDLSSRVDWRWWKSN